MARFHCNRFICVGSSGKGYLLTGTSLISLTAERRITTAFAELQGTNLYCRQSHSVHVVTQPLLRKATKWKVPGVLGNYSTLQYASEGVTTRSLRVPKVVTNY